MQKIFLLILLFSFSYGCHTEPLYNSTIDPNNFQATYLEELIFERVNEVRESYNAQPLEWENRLQQAAASQAENMKDWNRVSHHQISLSKFSLSNRMKYFGIKNQAVGENLADIYLETPMEVNFAKEPVIIREYKEAADALVLSWKYSPGHFNNLVDPKFKYTGIKVQINASTKIIYAAQVFGS